MLHTSHRTPAWREHLRRDIAGGLSRRPSWSFEFAEPAEAAQQVGALERHLAQRVDGLVLAAIDPARVHDVLARYRAAGIAVVLMSTDVGDPALYDALVLTDNRHIGRVAAEFFVEVMEGHGDLVEVHGRQPGVATELRAAGFREVLAEHPGMRIVDTCAGDWLHERAAEAFGRALDRHRRVDGVFAHNDAMALGASEAAQRAGRGDEMLITGVDAFAGEGGTIRFVTQGQLAATFLNPSPGKAAVHALLSVIDGEPVQKRTMLKTSLLRSPQRIRAWQEARRR